MNEDKITEILESHGIDEDKIIQIIDQLKEESDTKISDDFADINKTIVEEDEKDPLEVAASVARMISKSLDEESTP